MEFIFECSHRYRTSERSERVRFRMYYSVYYINAVYDDFPKISDHFPKIFQNCFEGLTNVSEHFSNIFRRLPKEVEDF